MSFLKYLQECNVYQENEFTPLVYEGNHLGYIYNEMMKGLFEFPDIFHFRTLKSEKSFIEMKFNNSDFLTISSRFNDVTKSLLLKGIIKNRHGEEFYRVSLQDFSKPIFQVLRCAVPFFGFRIYGVHLNGFTPINGRLYMWAGKRGQGVAEAGKFDHLVCGGQPAHLTFAENLLKESEEEASIPNEYLKQVKSVGATSCWTQIGKTLNRFTPFMFDLELPEKFKPKNIDGALESFSLIDVQELYENPSKIREFKSSCFPVLISFLIRHGYIKSDHLEYLDLCAFLTKGLYDSPKRAF